MGRVRFDLIFDTVHAGRVAAGAIAEKYLKLSCGVDIVAFVSSVGPVELPIEQVQQLIGTVTREQVDRDPVRCPVPSFAEQMTRVRTIEIGSSC